MYIQCRILVESAATNENGVNFNNTIGFSDWVDVQDVNGKWWIGQIIGEKMEAGSKQLQVKYAAFSQPPNLNILNTDANASEKNTDVRVTDNDGESKAGIENVNEQKSEETSINNLMRRNSDDQTYEFWWEMLRYSDATAMESWVSFMMIWQLFWKKHIAIKSITSLLI